MKPQIRDLESESQKWDDVRALVPSSDMIVLKNLRNSAFARIVFGYLGDAGVAYSAEWDGDDLRVIIG